MKCYFCQKEIAYYSKQFADSGWSRCHPCETEFKETQEVWTKYDRAVLVWETNMKEYRFIWRETYGEVLYVPEYEDPVRLMMFSKFPAGSPNQIVRKLKMYITFS